MNDAQQQAAPAAGAHKQVRTWKRRSSALSPQKARKAVASLARSAGGPMSRVRSAAVASTCSKETAKGGLQVRQ